MRVRLKGVALERTRDFGDVGMAFGLWRPLELHGLLHPATMTGRTSVIVHLACTWSGSKQMLSPHAPGAL